jgi:hypothetical protein
MYLSIYSSIYLFILDDGDILNRSDVDRSIDRSIDRDIDRDIHSDNHQSGM